MLHITPVSLSCSPFLCLPFKLPLSVFQTVATNGSLSNYHCLSLSLSVSLFQITTVSLLFTISVSLLNYHCLSIKLPLSLYQTTTVSLSTRFTCSKTLKAYVLKFRTLHGSVPRLSSKQSEHMQTHTLTLIITLTLILTLTLTLKMFLKFTPPIKPNHTLYTL